MLYCPLNNILGASLRSPFKLSINGILRQSLLCWCANRFYPEQLAFVDKIGVSIRPLHQLQYIQGDGIGGFTHPDLSAACMLTGNQGTATVTFSAGWMDLDSGTLWNEEYFEIEYPDGHIGKYAFCSLWDDAGDVGGCFDLNLDGQKNLTADGFTTLSDVCAESREIGSNLLDERGYSNGDGAIYPTTTSIPASTTTGLDALGNATQYLGRAKYNITPKAAPCVQFDGTGSLAVTKDDVAYDFTGSTISNMGDAEVAISTSSITCAGTGKGYKIEITESGGNIITFPCSESEGTTIFGYDSNGDTYQAQCTGFTDEEAIWGTQSEYFHGLEHGFSAGGLGPELIPTDLSLIPTFNPDDNIAYLENNTVLIITTEDGERVYLNLSSYVTSGIYCKLSVNFEILEGSPQGGNINLDTRYDITTTQVVSIDGVAGSAVRIGNGTSGNSSTTQTIIKISTISAREVILSTVQIPANPYNSGYDCLGNALTNQPLKFGNSCGYQLPDSHEVRLATRWEYGTANDWFDADGTPNTLTLDEIIAACDGQYTFWSEKYGVIILPADRTTQDVLKLVRALRYDSVFLTDDTYLYDEFVLY